MKPPDPRLAAKAARRDAREAHSLLTGADVPLEVRLKVGAALEALQDLLAGDPTPAAHARALDTWHAKLMTICHAVARQRARAN